MDRQAPELDDAEEADERLECDEKIRREVEALRLPHSNSSAGRYVTISIGGAATVPAHEFAMTSLIETADLALYRAKRDGKNRVFVNADSGASGGA